MGLKWGFRTSASGSVGEGLELVSRELKAEGCRVRAWA